MRMKNHTLSIFSWNVNGIRAGLKKGTFQTFIQTYHPDILCLQETKATKDQVDIDLPDYTEYWHSAEKKGYSGTALFSKKPAQHVIYGLLPDILKKGDLIDDHGRNGAEEGHVVLVFC